MKPIVIRFALLLGVLLLSAGVVAEPALQAPSPQQISPQESSPQAWERLIVTSGVGQVLEQTNSLIEQEITNLEKAPLGFSAQQLETMRNQLRQQLGSEQLKRNIIARLEEDFSSQQMGELQSVLASNQLHQLQQLQQQLSDANVRRAVRAYRLKVMDGSPNQQRLELLSALDQQLQQSALETELKVELRKQLLATVSHVKASETFSETMLENQLQQYRSTVEGEISENALFAYLYLLKRTPSSTVRELVVSLDQPAFDAFMALCLQSVQDSFRDARAQIEDDVQLAGN
ncbi:MAG: hypothetical protein VYA55_05900 [Pseudomonadota bacterium]|nr:hypothetical protein [Pseudomonadota bacterium]